MLAWLSPWKSRIGSVGGSAQATAASAQARARVRRQLGLQAIDGVDRGGIALHQGGDGGVHALLLLHAGEALEGRGDDPDLEVAGAQRGDLDRGGLGVGLGDALLQVLGDGVAILGLVGRAGDLQRHRGTPLGLGRGA
jgi:hypothetical protein